MIFVQLNESNFEYDIYSLVKAFYPKEELIVSPKEPDDDQIEQISFLLIVEYEPKFLTVYEVDHGRITGFEADIDYANRPDTKNRLKKLIYQILEQRCGHGLPWGTLTGIRPTKISLRMIEEGHSDEEIRQYMQSTYLTSDEKIDSCLAISHKEHEILKSIDLKNSYSLYVGIPFCPSTCAYCSFTSYPIGIWKKRIDEYLDALDKELKATKELFLHKELISIYIGGGTPTSLDEVALDRLLTIIETHFNTASVREYTIEAGRPDSITKGKFEVIQKHGLSRISVNPQTMNQKTLDIIGRHTTIEQFEDAYALARKMGFDDINMDLILGLPDETLDDVKYTLKRVKELAPDNLTVHSLAIKHSARLNYDADSFNDYLILNSQKHMDAAAQCAKELGMEPYYLYRQKNMAANLENIGYCTPGKEGLYNILIMEEVQDIAACGCGVACKKINPDMSTSRCENVKDVGLYIDKIDDMIERKRSLYTVEVEG